MDRISQHHLFWMFFLSLSYINRVSFQNTGCGHMTQSFAIQQIQQENIEDKLSSNWTIFIRLGYSLDWPGWRSSFCRRLSPNTPVQCGYGGKRVYCLERNIQRWEGKGRKTTLIPGKIKTKSVPPHLHSPVGNGNFCSTKVTSSTTHSRQCCWGFRHQITTKLWAN